MGISSSHIAGVDIGYGGLKIVAGPASGQTVDEFLLPAGAAPLTSMPRRSDASADLKGGESVLLDGVEWAGGVDQVHIQNRSRMTHDDYPRTPEYRALYLTSLARIRERKVDALVTGLPVSQFYASTGKELALHVRQLMTGKHTVNADVQVDVGYVMVVPQPLGTYFGLASEKQYEELATEDQLRTLVIDPGFFSVDWVVMTGKSVQHQYSGTSKNATSMILEAAAKNLTEKHQREISRDQLDASLRRNKLTISAGFGNSIDITTALTEASKQVVDVMVGELKTSLRTAGPIDLVILTGGGSKLYDEGIRQAYGNTTILSPSDVVLGNARGYHAIAKLKANREGRQPAAA